MTIRKKDPEGTRLVGAAFQLMNSDGKHVAAGKTDEQGNLVFDKLPAGTYRLRETSSGSPVHDLVPEQTITITVGRTAQANPLDLVDPFKKARLSVKKTDKNTGKTLPGAVIAIRADETDKTGKHTPGKVITSLTTGTDGTATAPSTSRSRRAPATGPARPRPPTATNSTPHRSRSPPGPEPTSPSPSPTSPPRPRRRARAPRPRHPRPPPRRRRRPAPSPTPAPTPPPGWPAEPPPCSPQEAAST